MTGQMFYPDNGLDGLRKTTKATVKEIDFERKI
jgi:hypothetical protein